MAREGVRRGGETSEEEGTTVFYDNNTEGAQTCGGAERTQYHKHVLISAEVEGERDDQDTLTNKQGMHSLTRTNESRQRIQSHRLVNHNANTLAYGENSRWTPDLMRSPLANTRQR